MSISEIIEGRGIERIIHFTTNHGALGVLATKSLKARARLREDELLTKVVKINAEDRRRDADWHDYVNLSITDINTFFFGASAWEHRDKDYWWCILSFEPVILTHSGVWFTTTNNMYSGVSRAQGADGLSALFAPAITQWNSYKEHRRVNRSSIHSEKQPTCSQAEVLYPGQVSTEFLREIFVKDNQSFDELAAQIAVVAHRPVTIRVEPDFFKNAK
jgi:ssDNA thymidine ADP-ribosyltransferase, DarT